MIIETTLTSQVRIFNSDMANYMADPYDGICTFTYMNSATVFVSGLNGNINRKMYRDLIHYIHSKNIKKVIAERIGIKRLPFATMIGDNLYELDVDAIISRIK